MGHNICVVACNPGTRKLNLEVEVDLKAQFCCGRVPPPFRCTPLCVATPKLAVDQGQDKPDLCRAQGLDYKIRMAGSEVAAALSSSKGWQLAFWCRLQDHCENELKQAEYADLNATADMVTRPFKALQGARSRQQTMYEHTL